MRLPNEITCPACGSNDIGFELTPDQIHFGKYVCNACDRFIQWAKKPKRVKSFSGGLCRFRGTLPPRMFLLTDETGERLASVKFDPDMDLESGEAMNVQWTILMG